MIISGGMNIYPAEIEAALEQHPKIYNVAVFGIPSEEWGELVHATIVVAPGADLTEAEVMEFSRAHLRVTDAPLGRVRRRTAAHGLRQDPQAGTARALLAGPYRQRLEKA